MTTESRTTTIDIGFTSLLAILFIAFKLSHIIDWSWWWVLAPIWIPIALVLIFFALGVARGLLVELFKPKRGNR